jgi:uncharacterized membrane-anchored protein YjiN (DUF445 family)
MEMQPDKAAALSRMKWLAFALLLAAAALYALAKFHHEAGPWAWASAFAEAAMVGALADWFAIVALFRHPLGLPIPHTAILPANKARVADNLAAFIRDKFLGTDAMIARVNAFDPAGRLAVWLAEPANAQLLGTKAVAAAARMVDFIDDDRVKTMLRDALRRRAQELDLAGAVGHFLTTLTADRRQQLLLDEALRQLAHYLDREDVQQALANKIVEVAGEEYPKLIGMLGFVGMSAEDLGHKFAGGLVRGATKWLHEIGDDPSHERRVAFDRKVEAFIEKLKSDPAFKARIDEQKHQWLERPELGLYVNSLWDEFKGWLHRDLAAPDSTLHAKVASAATSFAAALSDDPALRASINDHVRDAMKSLAPELRDGIAQHIASTVRQWDDATLVRDVELNIGRDLQFIRLNGTLVGGAVGLIIHAVSTMIG